MGEDTEDWLPLRERQSGGGGGRPGPYLNSSGYRSPDFTYSCKLSREINREAEEDKRMSYRAMTEASDSLVVVG